MPKDPADRYRRSPFLVCYWEGGRLVFHNYVTGRRISASAFTCEILSLLDRWQNAASICNNFPSYTRSSITASLRELVKQTILQHSKRKAPDAERRAEQWKKWHPFAGFFHFSTKNGVRGPNQHAATAYKSLLRQAKRNPMPRPVKRYRGAREIPLPSPRVSGEFPKVLLKRRTWRRFSTRPVEIADLSTLLGLTWRVQRWERAPGLGLAALKTSPSGGALHPIEAYVLVRSVKSVPRGLYHYSADRHCLEMVRRGVTGRQISTYLLGQSWGRSAAALVMMTAIFSRTGWKYADARSYRVILIEAGHLCQTFCLVATWLGLAPFCTMALADERIENDLGLDGVKESVLYAAGVGTRPRGLEWAPAPHKRDAPWWPR
jgi:SagB-type dehydrogenase family enzyme